MLTDFNGIQITYDEIGNPTAIGEAALSWDGRQLKQVVDGGSTYSYAYNIDGQRVSKTVTERNGTVTTTEYFYNGEILAGQKTGDTVVVFQYDNNNDYFGFTVDGRQYYYVKNNQNDVVAITNADGNIVARYYYDAWGTASEHYLVAGQEANDSSLNPFLYRSYYMDDESGFYYLNTRYYISVFSRFLNADDTDVLYEDQGSVLENNLFSYCLNNPANMFDADGEIAITTCVLIGLAVGAAVGGGSGAYISYKKYRTVKLKYVVAGIVIGGAVGAAVGYGVGIAIGASGAPIVGSGGKGLIRAINKTKIKNTKLSNWIKECFRTQSKIGNGSLADAIRYEKRFGRLVGGKSHIVKGWERVRGLQRIINSGTLSKPELILANKLLADLQRSLNGK